MARSGKRWTVYDRDGRPIYLSEERWQHIIDEDNHPELVVLEDQLKTTIRKGRRTQEPQNSRKYRYSHRFSSLPDGSTHIVAIVIYSITIDDQGIIQPNNWMSTAFLQHIRSKG